MEIATLQSIQMLKGQTMESMVTYLSCSKFWFESYQNWQSELLSIFAIIFLSIYQEKKDRHSQNLSMRHMQKPEGNITK